MRKYILTESLKGRRGKPQKRLSLRKSLRLPLRLWKNTQIRKIGKIVKIIIAKIFIKKLCLFFAEDMKWHSKH